MSKATGGPAFPLGQTPEEWMNGMTLRDYFAAKVIVPMVAHRVSGHVSYGNEQEIAKRAYEIADAMIAERAK